MNRTGNKRVFSAKSVPVRHELRKPLKAHDVRHLCVCEGCKGLGDDRDTVRSLENPSPFGWHPKCFYERYGEEAILKFLSKDDQDKFRLCDIPSKVMKRLLDSRATG